MSGIFLDLWFAGRERKDIIVAMEEKPKLGGVEGEVELEGLSTY